MHLSLTRTTKSFFEQVHFIQCQKEIFSEISRSFLKKKHPEACLGLSKIYDEVFLQKRLTAKNHYYRKMATSNMFAKVPSTTVGFNSSDDKLYSKLTLTHSKSILHSYRNYS